MADSPLVWTAKSMMVVVPPQAAAREPVSKVSAAKVPPNGSSMWVCTSTPPGATMRPPASITRSAATPSAAVRAGSRMAVTRRPSISTSACMLSAAVTTKPLVMSVEAMPAFSFLSSV